MILFQFSRVLQNFIFWPDWALFKSAATVWTNIVQYIFNTALAKAAFETADHGFFTVIGQVFAAVFADGPQFEHNKLLN